MPIDTPRDALDDDAKRWPYAGSRWWKFDFHTHTPASADTYWAKNTRDLAARDWLLRYMAAEIDCLAVTDHNSGAWIDRLKQAYAEMLDQAAAGNAPEGFRELVLFPGVELSVQGGFHLLAVFDPTRSTSDLDTLLGTVDYQGTKGDSDGVTTKGGAAVFRAVVAAGGLAIPAHADADKGLLQTKQDGQSCQLDANTVRQVVDEGSLLAVEWLDRARPFPGAVERQARRLARVRGSDCHSFQGLAVPGSHFTWVKMARPTIEGLRLALLDGDDVSLRRSDQGSFDPFDTPTHFVTRIEIERARYMGHGTVAQLDLSPLFNGLIGGRGTGKSTIVHALRLAYRRHSELERVGEGSAPRRVFEQFRQVAKGRSGEGALREETEIRIELQRDGRRHRLRWRADGGGDVVEDEGSAPAAGAWVPSGSQEINPERFPIRIFSQGQIAALSGEGRGALLDIIDEGAQVAACRAEFDEATRGYLARRADLRELEGKLGSQSEVERKLAEVVAKLAVFEQQQHAEVLRAHQRALAQRREVDATLAQARSLPERIEAWGAALLLEDWRPSAFDAKRDAEVLAWRQRVDAAVATACAALGGAARELRARAAGLEHDEALVAWRTRTDQATADYEGLQERLAAEGVSDPNAFGRMVQERHQLEAQLGELNRVARAREQLRQESEDALGRVRNARAAITERRRAFLAATLHDNRFVRIEVSPCGHDPLVLERSLRQLLDATPETYADDLCRMEDARPSGGIAHEIAAARDRDAVLADVKQRLEAADEGFGGHFRNFLRRKLEHPEFADRVRAWFPDDDLKISYSRGGDGTDWTEISQGSQGQRSAALLAFLLSFGDEPMVLDQPEDDLDNHLIYELIVRQIRENKRRRQLIIVTHNPNVLVNGDAEMVHVFAFGQGQCYVQTRGALQESTVREEVCRVMEGGREAFGRRWARLGREGAP